MKISTLFLSDHYKYSHPKQYPVGTEYVYSNTTPRGSRMEGVDEVVVFGIQYLVKEYLINQFNEFFESPKSDIAKFKRVMDHTLGKDSVDYSKFEALHEFGYLPVRIKALPEGTRCPLRVPFMTIVNTHPEFYWLTNFLETLTQTVVWQAVTSATIADRYRKLFDSYAEMTVGNNGFVQFQGHDFSMRGMSSVESGAVSGAGHLLSFSGTDSMPSICFLEQYYGGDVEKELIGCSVPATEHAVTCAGGEENEQETFRRLIEDVYPSGIVSLVSDTWDFWGVLTNILPALKEKIMARNGKTVIRPDCYDSQTEILTNSGWKYFSQLTEEDLVAQVLEDGTREFVKPNKIVNQQYNGDMCHFVDHFGKVDLLVTPNHRMVILQSGKERVVEASKLGRYGNYDQKMIRSAPNKSNPNETLSNMERLRIAFQADGSFCSDCHTNIIRFSFSKQRKIDRLKSILDSLSIQYKIYDLSDGKFEFHIHLDVYDFSKNFNWVSLNKSKEWCQEFIEECSYWDSCRRSDERFKFDSTNLSVVNVVKEIALSAGYGVLKSTYSDDRKECFSDVYTLHIMKNNTVGGQSWEKKIIPYNGTVHCVSVPSGKVFVRRNKCTMVSGNSGDPVRIVCGYDVKSSELHSSKILKFMEAEGVNKLKFYEMFEDYDCLKTSDGKYFTSKGEITELEAKGAIEVLWDIFGGTINSKGYRELDSHIGLIYGDSITYERASRICELLEYKGLASTNLVYGIGSYTYQYNTRDTFSIACKATHVVINGVPKDIAKNPKTDNGTKKSAKGLLTVVRENGKLVLIDQATPEQEASGELVTIFEDGVLKKEYTLREIRERLKG